MLRVWDPARPTRLLTDASELAVSAILEQPDNADAFQYLPHLLELLAVLSLSGQTRTGHALVPTALDDFIYTAKISFILQNLTQPIPRIVRHGE